MSRNRGYASIIRNLTLLIGTGVYCFCLATALLRAAPLDTARSAYQRADFATVIQLLDNRNTMDSESWMLLGKASYHTGRFADASAAFRRALESGGDTAECRNWLGRALGMQAERGNPLSALGLARKARDEFQKAVEMDPRNLEAVSDLFSFYLAAPGFLGGGADKARALAETVKELDTAEYAGMRAQLAEKQKDYAGAEQWLKRSIAAAPKSVGRRVDLARFYTRREVLEKADAALAEARALQPGAARLLFDEANLLVRGGRNPARARRLLQQYQSAARGPEDPSPFETAQLEARLEKLEKETSPRQ